MYQTMAKMFPISFSLTHRKLSSKWEDTKNLLHHFTCFFSNQVFKEIRANYFRTSCSDKNWFMTNSGKKILSTGNRLWAENGNVHHELWCPDQADQGDQMIKTTNAPKLIRKSPKSSPNGVRYALSALIFDFMPIFAIHNGLELYAVLWKPLMDLNKSSCIQHYGISFILNSSLKLQISTLNENWVIY